MFRNITLVALLTSLVAPAIACADGGTVRFSGRRDGLRITVFTAPTHLRAGLVDVSVLLQDSDAGTPRWDIPVQVSAYPAHEPWRRHHVPATVEAATNKFLRAASMKFAEPGSWHVEVAVQEPGREQTIHFEVEVAEAPPPRLDMSLWVAWPLLAIAGFALHQWLVQRRRAIGT